MNASEPVMKFCIKIERAQVSHGALRQDLSLSRAISIKQKRNLLCYGKSQHPKTLNMLLMCFTRMHLKLFHNTSVLVWKNKQ